MRERERERRGRSEKEEQRERERGGEGGRKAWQRLNMAVHEMPTYMYMYITHAHVHIGFLRWRVSLGCSSVVCGGHVLLCYFSECIM